MHASCLLFGGKSSEEGRVITQPLTRPSQMSRGLTALEDLLSPNRAHQGFQQHACMAGLSATNLLFGSQTIPLALITQNLLLDQISPSQPQIGQDSGYAPCVPAALAGPHRAGCSAPPRSRLTQAGRTVLPGPLTAPHQCLVIHLIY